MITQERFDKAYHRIVELRDIVTKWRNNCQEHEICREAFGQEKGLSQAIAILQEASCDE